MKSTASDKRVPGYRIQPTLDAVHRYRNAWSRHHRPEDVNKLLKLFRNVKLESGYLLDYLSLGHRETGRIWPYARPEKSGRDRGLPTALERVPSDQLVGVQPGGSLRRVEIETLYRFLSHERSPLGLTEYGFFVQELWSLKSNEWTAEWLSLEPLVVRHNFDAVLRTAGSQLVRVARPDHCDPLVQMGEGGGRVVFLAYQPGPWRRIVQVELTIEAAGPVNWRPLEVVASLQRS